MASLLWIIAVLALALLVYTVWGIVRLQSPTKGRPIDRAARPGKALVVIDVQEDFTHLKGKYAWDPTYLDQRLAAITRATAQAKTEGIPIVTVRQTLEGALAVAIARCLAGSAGAKGSPGLGLDKRLSFSADAERPSSNGCPPATPCSPPQVSRPGSGPTPARPGRHARHHHLTPPTICRRTTTYGGGSLRSSAKTPHTMAHVPASLSPYLRGWAETGISLAWS